MPTFTFNPQTTEYQPQHAYWLGKAASLAYRDEAVIRAETAAWGFDRFQFYYSKHKPPFLIDDTQAYTIANDQMIITAFRGTTPTMISDWLTDANTPAVPGPGKKGLVHLGFNLALGSVYPSIGDKIRELRTNNQTLWFTGHSLGAALAMLAAARMHFEDPKLLASGVYTFGQPRTFDHLFAKAYDADLKPRTFRFVNNNDIVPHAPPDEVIYHHAGTLMYFDVDGKLHDKWPFWNDLKDKFKGLTSSWLAPGTDGIRDHSMDRYLANLEKNLV
ncbi:MAG TPA: lipase family protein [Blastocatellia bacterium]|nr:lipase family protein [Blastocatellia bacterium]